MTALTAVDAETHGRKITHFSSNAANSFSIRRLKIAKTPVIMCALVIEFTYLRGYNPIYARLSRMITYINMPAGCYNRRLPFFLAAEEFAARCLPSDSDYFFMWRVSPTVIIGRNQIFETEVNASYCRSNGIAMWRRKSGGGCVYADRDNIMFSYITDSGDDVAHTFAGYTRKVAAMLRGLGLEATAGGRNDVLIGDRKISGNAFYRLPNGRSIAHGTMLFDLDIDRMMRAITPSRIKLESKGIDSVRSRVTSVREHVPQLSIEDFMDHARSHMSDAAITLSTDDVDEIERMEVPYLSEKWIYGHSPRGSVSVDRRIEGVGDFHVEMTMQGGRIENINMSGDFFLTADLDSCLLDRIHGTLLTPEGLDDALGDFDPSKVIMGLTRGAFADLLLG